MARMLKCSYESLKMYLSRALTSDLRFDVIGIYVQYNQVTIINGYQAAINTSKNMNV